MTGTNDMNTGNASHPRVLSANGSKTFGLIVNQLFADIIA
jgi:hypothetical protein